MAYTYKSTRHHISEEQHQIKGSERGTYKGMTGGKELLYLPLLSTKTERLEKWIPTRWCLHHVESNFLMGEGACVQQ
jgi:hypothetical protein